MTIQKAPGLQNTYNIAIPEFIVVGISNPSVEVVNSKNDILSFITEDIDTHKLSNNAMSDDTLVKYIDMNKEWLKDPATDYYQRLLTSIDPEATLSVTFSE